MHGTSARDPVSRVLLPVLVHEVNNATQLLVGLRALLDLPGGEPLFARRADDLARTSARMEELGLALAVLATAGGANMLLARRDERALGIVWGLAVHALERSGEARVRVRGAVPRVAASALDGWQVPWAAAALLLHASERAGAEAWRWTWEAGGRLVGRAEGSADLDEGLLALVAERVPGAELDARADELALALPAAWLAAPRS